MAFNIGLNIVEVDGVGTPAIVGASTSVGAFNITTQRGIPNTPVSVTSFPKFVERFGSYFPNGLGAYLVKGFFDNGGQTAYINRVVASDASSGARPASITLKNSAGTDILTLRAGYRGVDDPGTWGGDLYATIARRPEARLRETTPATVRGTALSAPVDLTGLPPLRVNVDKQPLEVTFKEDDFPGGVTAATPAQIRDAINKRTTKLKASLTEDNSLELKSTGETAKLTGDFTRLQVTAANEKLGFATPPAEAVVGTPAPRTSTGAQLSDVSTFKIGDAVRITDGTETTSVRLVTRSPLRGDVTWVPEVADIADFDPLTLRASRATFDLSIAYGGGEPNKVVETWADLSMDPEAPNYVESIINDQTAGSKYVTAIDLRSPGSANATDLPAPSTAFTPVTVQGRDGTPIASDFIGDAAARTGFFAFDPFDVQLLGCERTDREVTTAALGYCAGREDCMYVGAVPESFVESGAGHRLRAGISGQEGLRRAVRSLDQGGRSDRQQPGQVAAAGRSRHGRLRPNSDQPRHLEGARRRRGQHPRGTRRRVSPQRRRTHRAGQGRQRQRDSGGAALGHHRRCLAHTLDRYALALRQRSAAVQLT